MKDKPEVVYPSFFCDKFYLSLTIKTTEFSNTYYFGMIYP